MEITAEDVHKLIVNTDDIKVKKTKIRSERQKENDIKLKERLTEYHRKKRELKNNSVEIALIHIDDSLIELQEMKEDVEITKTKRGRLKKHLHPAAEAISCSV